MAVCGRWCVDHWAQIRDERRARRKCNVPSCDRGRWGASPFCSTHIYRVEKGYALELTLCLCGRPHPAVEPPDPPLPPGLSEACSAFLVAWGAAHPDDEASINRLTRAWIALDEIAVPR